MEDQVKLPPNSEEAELCVLGSILIDNDAVLNVSEFLRPEHFYNLNSPITTTFKPSIITL